MKPEPTPLPWRISTTVGSRALATAAAGSSPEGAGAAAIGAWPAVGMPAPAGSLSLRSSAWLMPKPAPSRTMPASTPASQRGGRRPGEPASGVRAPQAGVVG
jgi:hypothetical protein